MWTQRKTVACEFGSLELAPCYDMAPDKWSALSKDTTKCNCKYVLFLCSSSYFIILSKDDSEFAGCFSMKVLFKKNVKDRKIN